MSRPEPRPDRPPIEVRIRDLEKIRERAPLRVEPRHIRRTLLLVLGLVGLAFAGGFLLGSGMMSPPEPIPSHAGEPARVVLSAPLPDDPAPDAPPVPSGLPSGLLIEEGEARPPSGSVAPVPTPEPGPEPVPAPAPVPVPSSEPVPAPDPEPAPLPEPAPAREPAPVPAVTPQPVPVVLPDTRACEDVLSPGGRRGFEPHVQAVGLPVPWSVVRVSDPEAGCSRLSPADECFQAAAVEEPPELEAPTPEPEPEPEPEPVPVPVPVPEPVPVPAEADAEVESPVPSPAVQSERVPPKPSRRYQVQVRAYQDEEAANTYAASLVEAGYPARVMPFVDARGKHWFRIRIGRYNSQAEAQAFSREFNQRHNEQSVTVEVP